MAAILTKIIDGDLPTSGAIADGYILECRCCGATYSLTLTDNEWHRVKDWFKLADTAIRKDHDLRHKAATIPLEWRGIRRR